MDNAKDKILHWEDCIPLTGVQWWTGDATKRIEAQVGLTDKGQPLRIYFGVDEENRPCAHGALVAMTGAGKTAFFHSLIASLTVSYSPEEMQLILMDGKMGVGFNIYRKLPHVGVISLNTKSALARSLLSELVDEMLRRNALFKKNGVEHFIAYRQKGSPEGLLPRILLIADEYQILFEDDEDQQAANTLLKLSEQARSVGIHLLLGSQHASPANIIHRDLIFSNIHLRIAMKMAPSEIAASTEFGYNSKELIERTCTKTGRVVINDYAGDDSKSISGTIAFLNDTTRQALLEHMVSGRKRTEPQVILDGDSQPDLYENPLFQRLLTTNCWDSPSATQQIARGLTQKNGLGITDWSSSESPIALFLGREQNVRGQTVATLRRRQYENLCIIGEQHLERTGMLVSSITGACLQLSPSQLQLLFADRSIQGTDWSQTLSTIAQVANRIGYKAHFAQRETDILKLIASAFHEAKKRQALQEQKKARLPSIIVVLSELERVQSLQRIPNDYDFDDSEQGKQLQLLLEQGPHVGIHVLASFSTVGAAKRVFEEKKLQLLFRHKIAMQMSEDDSYGFIRSAKACKLQSNGPTPILALLVDSQVDHLSVFSPYSIKQVTGLEESTPAHSKVIAVFEQLQQRKNLSTSPHPHWYQKIVKK